jgi:hypothetical protein
MNVAKRRGARKAIVRSHCWTRSRSLTTKGHVVIAARHHLIFVHCIHSIVCIIIAVTLSRPQYHHGFRCTPSECFALFAVCASSLISGGRNEFQTDQRRTDQRLAAEFRKWSDQRREWPHDEGGRLEFDVQQHEKSTAEARQGP